MLALRATLSLWLDLATGENLLEQFEFENQPQIGLRDLLVGIVRMAMADTGFGDLTEVIAELKCQFSSTGQAHPTQGFDLL